MPDGNPKYAETPRPESIEFLRQRLSQHRAVVSVEIHSLRIFRIERRNRREVIAYLTNLYVVGEADVVAILDTHPEVNAIVVASAWNSYSPSARRVAREQGVGVFRVNEFLGALNYDGRRFFDYEPP